MTAHGFREFWFVLQDEDDSRVIDESYFRDVTAAEDHGYMLAATNYMPIAVFEKITVCLPKED